MLIYIYLRLFVQFYHDIQDTFPKYLDQNFISVNKQHSLIKAAEVPQCNYFLTHLISLQLSALRKLLSGLVTRIVRWLFHFE